GPRAGLGHLRTEPVGDELVVEALAAQSFRERLAAFRGVMGGVAVGVLGPHARRCAATQPARAPAGPSSRPSPRLGTRSSGPATRASWSRSAPMSRRIAQQFGLSEPRIG